MNVGNEKYVLRCVECGKVVKDECTDRCPLGHNSLLRTEYRAKQLTVRNLPGLFKYIDFLPVESHLPVDSGPVTYKSEGLSKELGLKNLYITFSGYWPERHANIKTCSFKELEALPTVVRVKEKCKDTLVVASAGNTSRAFAQMSSLTQSPVVTVVPKCCLDRMWTTQETDNVCLISVKGDYTDAINMGEKISSLDGFAGEGGAKNVARRDGMATVLLDAVVFMKRLPEYYFQGVGSGTGAIACWEASMRIIRDGRFGKVLPKFCLSQNLPFVPMYSAWMDRRREIVPEKDMIDAESSIREMRANVLSNRNPPYSVAGGVYDMLCDAGGTIECVTNREADDAGRLFVSAEEIDLDPAASVTIASLAKAVEEQRVGSQDRILLNVTGGGYERVREDYDLYEVKPCSDVCAGAGIEDVKGEIDEWVREHT